MDELIEIARRKERLIARCAAQREAVAGVFSDLRQPIAVADRVLSVARFLQSHPLLVAAAVAAVVAFRRRNLLGLAARGLAAWRMWRAISAWAGGVGLQLARGRGPERR